MDCVPPVRLEYCDDNGNWTTSQVMHFAPRRNWLRVKVNEKGKFVYFLMLTRSQLRRGAKCITWDVVQFPLSSQYSSRTGGTQPIRGLKKPLHELPRTRRIHGCMSVQTHYVACEIYNHACNYTHVHVKKNTSARLPGSNTKKINAQIHPNILKYTQMYSNIFEYA